MQISEDRQKPATTLGITIAAHFVNDGLDTVLPLIVPILMILHSLSLFEAGLMMTSYSATTLVFQPLLVYVADITRHKKVCLASGLVLMGLSLCLIQFAPSLLWILLFAFVAGIGYSIYHPVAMSFVNMAYMERRGFGLGFHGLGGSLGRGVYPTVLGILLAVYGLGEALIFTLGMALFAAILVLNLPAVAGRREAVKFSLTSTYVILITGVNHLLRNVFYGGIVNFVPIYLVRELHQDMAAAGVATSMMLILGIVSQPLGGHLSDRIGRRAVLGMSCLLMGVFFILFLWISYPVSLILLSLVGFSIFLGFPLPYAVIGDHVSKESMSTALGIVSGMASVGGIIAPLFVGRLGDQYGLGNAMFFVSFFAFAASGVCLLLPRSSA